MLHVGGPPLKGVFEEYAADAAKIRRYLRIEVAAKGRQSEKVICHHRDVRTLRVWDGHAALHAGAVERHERAPRREYRLRMIALARLAHAVIGSENDIGSVPDPRRLQSGDEPRELRVYGFHEVLDVFRFRI